MLSRSLLKRPRPQSQHTFSRAFHVYKLDGSVVSQSAFSIRTLQVPAHFSGNPYILSHDDKGCIHMTESGAKHAYRTATQNLPEISTPVLSLNFRPRPHRIFPMSNAVMSDCAAGMLGLDACKWLLQLIVSRDISVSKGSGCEFARLFGTRDGTYTINGTIPPGVFEDCLVMNDAFGNKVLILNESTCVFMHEYDSFCIPWALCNTSHIRFASITHKLSVPLGLP